MAKVIVKNNLNPGKAVFFDVTILKCVDKGMEGEEKYYIEIGTTHSGIKITNDNGTYEKRGEVRIRPGYIDNISSKNLDGEFSKVLGKLSSYIDWRPLLSDTEAPYISHIEPIGDNVSIFSNINLSIKDDIPTSGIDLSEMKIVLNNGVVDFDITSEVEVSGDPFEYSIFWAPTIREV